jgi:hypothetical protein
VGEIKLIISISYEPDSKYWYAHGRVAPGGAFFTEAKTQKKLWKMIWDAIECAKEASHG